MGLAPAVLAIPPLAPATDPLELLSLRAPTFAKRVFDIREFGASHDDTVPSTQAIAHAIRAAHRAGGGRVVIPAGSYFTGPIHLQSNVELHLADGSTLRFSDDPNDYRPPVLVRWNGFECYNYSSLIYASDCENVGITGPGRMLGNGPKWWGMLRDEQRAVAELYRMSCEGVAVSRRMFGTDAQPLRPQFVMFINCRQVLLDEFTIAEGGPHWTIHIAYGRDVVMRRLHIHATEGPNNDGIVIDSSRNVLIEDCDVRSSEDCISLKAGMNEDGLRVSRPTENVLVERVRGGGGAGGVAIGSEMSGGVRNVVVRNCQFEDVRTGVRLKAARGRGGVVERVHFRDITLAGECDHAVQVTSEHDTFVKNDGLPPTFRAVQIERLSCHRAKRTAVNLTGLADAPLRDLELNDVKINSAEGLHCSSAVGLNLRDVHIRPDLGPVLALRDTQEATINGLSDARPYGTFLDLRGRHTRGIRLTGESTHRVRPAIVLGLDVPRDAILDE
ncbi:MAG: glycoside hydrolase family 28 protein [Tepidisphaeraceae bacterium]